MSLSCLRCLIFVLTAAYSQRLDVVVDNIRLVGGRTQHDGIVQVEVDGNWGTLASLFGRFDMLEANVICRMLHFSVAESISTSNNWYETTLSGTIHYCGYQFHCNGTESTLAACNFLYTPNSGCSHVYDVTVKCLNDIRLIHQLFPSSPNVGILNVFIDGVWLAICGKNVDHNAASVSCKQLGYRTGVSIANTTALSIDSTPVYNYTFQCKGQESTIKDCNIIEGIESTCDQAAVKCSGLFEDIRLVSGHTTNDGIVQIKLNGTWGTMYLNNIDINLANVLCQQLNFSEAVDVSHAMNWYTTMQSGPIHYCGFSFECNGLVSDLSACSFVYNPFQCQHGNDTAVRCLASSGVRLIHSAYKNMGYLVILSNGTWHTICKSDIDSIAASVVCKQLGFRVGVVKHNTRDFLRPDYPTYNQIIKCNESSSTIKSCEQSQNRTDQCVEFGAVSCSNMDVTDIRLEGGNKPLSGRVELKVDGVWGTVCSNKFHKEDADVLCRMLNNSLSKQVLLSYSGGNGPIYFNELSCIGDERTILECGYINSRDCTHSYDVGIECYPDGEIQLIGGRNVNSGIVTMFSDGQWNTICKSNFDDKVANIVCKQLGYRFELVIHNDGYFGTTDLPKNYKIVNCAEENSNLRSCNSSRPVNGSCKNYAAVSCSNLNVTGIRLENGIDTTVGRFEIESDGTWGTICGKNFDMQDADVLCRHLNFTSARTFYNAKFGSGIPVHITELSCTGNENTLTECDFTSTGSCYNGAVAIACYQELDIRLTNTTHSNIGQVDVISNAKWHLLCSDDMSTKVANVSCYALGYSGVANVSSRSNMGVDTKLVYNNTFVCNGTESRLSECEQTTNSEKNCSNTYNIVQCQGSSSRLVNSRADSAMKIVEVFHKGVWGTISAGSLPGTTARALCHLHGFGNVGFSKVLTESGGQSRSWLTSIACRGHESYIDECQLSNWEWMPNNNYVSGLRCSDFDGVRLIGGAFPHEGRVEIKIDAIWGTVCGENFQKADADVICRMLNYSSSRTSYSNALYGAGQGQILINNIGCLGTEASLMNCDLEYKPSSESSYHDYDVAVRCLREFDVQLEGGSKSSNGLLKIFSDNKWHSVCPDDISFDLANVACTSLGYSGVHSVNETENSFSNPAFNLSLSCNGTEAHLRSCNVKEESICNASRTKFINCTDLNIYAIRLVGKGVPYRGVVEVNVDGRVGTICSHEFGTVEADTICKTLRYVRSKRYTFISTNRSANTSVMSIRCGHVRTDIRECDIHLEPSNSTFCLNRHNVTVDCIGAIEDVRLVQGSGPHEGRAEVKIYDTWGTVGGCLFSSVDADTICRMLNYSAAKEHKTIAFYGEGTNSIYRLSCQQAYCELDDIPTCEYCTSSYSYYYCCCNHGQDVSVICLRDFEARLIGETTSKSGQLQVYNGTWKTVCPQEINYDLAHVACVSLGFSGVSNISRTPRAVISQLFEYKLLCNGTERHMSECAIFGNSYCNISESVLMECNDFNISTVRWVQNQTSYSGVVEVEIDGRTGTFCSVGFYSDAASSICQTLGYLKSVRNAYISSAHRIVNTTIITMACNGIRSHIRECELVIDYSNSSICYQRHNTTVECQRDCLMFVESTTIIGGRNKAYQASSNTDREQCKALCLRDNVCVDASFYGTTKICALYGEKLGPVDMLPITNIHDLHMQKDCSRGYCGFKPCFNNGTCSDKSGGYSCACASGFTGENCEIDINNCMSDSCMNAGICIDSVNSYTCMCMAGYFGERCTQEYFGASCLENSTLCSEIPNGLCIDSKCACKVGFNYSNGRCVPEASIGSKCNSHDACVSEGAKCINSTCRCESKYYDTVSDACGAMPLYPFGPKVGDTVMSNADDECSKAIDVFFGIPVFDTIQTKLHVCTNGLVSFRNAYTHSTPNEDIEVTETVLLVAPFYADATTLTTGNVYYRTYDILNNPEVISGPFGAKIKNDIQYFGQMENIHFILIATWDRVKPYQKVFNRDSEATFQMVLVSNGIRSSALFIYGHNLMNWTVQSNVKKVDVLSGYFVGKNYHHTNIYSFTKDILQLDKRAKTKGVFGVIHLPLTSLSSSIQLQNATQCIEWYNSNSHLEQINKLMSRKLPECPCSIDQLVIDPWFPQPSNNEKADIICVEIWPSTAFLPYGKSCCYYRNNGLWSDDVLLGGGLHMYHKSKFPREHELFDVIPRDHCCKGSQSQLCHLYSRLHPTERCYTKTWFTMAMFWGDPHIRTLDGKNFTFNGLGEYTMLTCRTNNISFDLQARTERGIMADGNMSEATIFSAFAARDSTNASLHVELNRNKTAMVIYGNGEDLTAKFAEANNSVIYVAGQSNLILSRQNNALAVFFPATGVRLNISVGVRMLTMNVNVPLTLINLTRGLLGNFDNNTDNDFISPDGQMHLPNMTERNIFAYGQSWAISATTSVFKYSKGKSHENYHNASYTPKFLDESHDQNKRQEAERVCNGSQNNACVYDFVFTNDPEIATHTMKTDSDGQHSLKEIEMTIPEIKGCDVLNVALGQNVVCHITAAPNQDLTSYYFIKNSVGATLDSNDSTLAIVQYVQNDTYPVLISVAAKNKNGKTSIPVTVTILLCTGCNGHGNCTGKRRYDNKETLSFSYESCECEPAYAGSDCELDFDGCASMPCSSGRNCTDVPAEQQLADNRTYTCNSCPLGTLETYEGKCIDIDECISKVCMQNCINKFGGYDCTCDKGYRLDSKTKNKCNDVDECEEGTHNCIQICTNTVGGFNCTCYQEYDYHESTRECVQANLRPCEESTLNCSMTAGCRTDKFGTPQCFCLEGFELTDNNSSCQDINECERNICPQKCTNFDGGFRCSCLDGYHLIESNVCEACSFPFWGSNCENICQCSGRGAKRCDVVRGCICRDGWSGDTCDDDIDECDTLTDICNDARKTCINYPGEYQCKCSQGYLINYNGSCEDINECSNKLLNNCSQTCTNIVGGYTCGCFSGYIYQNDTCQDIDECVKLIDGCEQICENTLGFYNCHCQFAYDLNDDRKTCTKMHDPCLTIENLTCEHYCIAENTSVKCGCRKGFFLSSDRKTCLDINECQSVELNHCSNVSFCQNTIGSYMCDCPIGSKLENDNRTCTVCDEFHFGKGCAYTCDCLHGINNKIQGCDCYSGWTGANCDIDQDECQHEDGRCLETNTQCVNIPGSFQCICISGYFNNSGSCIDIDECNSTSNNCSQKCINTEGGYECDCETGFVFSNGLCNDIDECKGNSFCQQRCDNTPGSFRCSCDDGFKLNLVDRRTCIPKQHCQDARKLNCFGKNASCVDINGKPTCVCDKGFIFNLGQTACVDIKECEQTPKPCSHLCMELEGSFRCLCNDGSYLLEDKTSCQECISGYYGKNCNHTCSCLKANTKSCNTTNGECLCFEGWNGTNCENNIDECANSDSYQCTTNSECFDTNGSYVCKCKDGYTKTATGQCQVCSSSFYGDSCRFQCSCNIFNTRSCDHVTGVCLCYDGWSGISCTEDINECLNETICTDNSKCTNKNGSYECICNNGFYKTDDGTCSVCKDGHYGHSCELLCGCNSKTTQYCDPENGTCICNKGWHGPLCYNDTNECQNSTTFNCTAHSHCINTAGSYTCECDNGYKKDNQCIACFGNTFGFSCNETCACSANGTINADQVCDHVTGQCMCNEFWTGFHCQNDVNECIKNNICENNMNTGCHNTKGGFICDCLRGFEKDEHGACTKSIPVTIPTEIAARSKVLLSVKLDVNSSGIDLKVSITYKEIEDSLKEAIRTFYKELISEPIIVIVKNLRIGSIEGDLIVLVVERDVSEALRNGAEKLAKGTTILYGGENIKIEAKPDFQVLQKCKCSGDDKCFADNYTSTCSAVKDEQVNVWIYVGIASAAVLVIIVIANAIVCLRLRKNHKKKALDEAMGSKLQMETARPYEDLDSLSNAGHRKWQDMASSILQTKTTDHVYEAIQSTVSSKYSLPRPDLGHYMPNERRTQEDDIHY